MMAMTTDTWQAIRVLIIDDHPVIRRGLKSLLAGHADLAVVGGFTAARRVAMLAQAANLQCAPHVWGSAILFAASLHLAAAIPNCPIFEFRTGSCGFFSDLLEEPFTIDSEGFVAVPEGPGLGVKFDLEESQRKFPFV